MDLGGRNEQGSHTGPYSCAEALGLASPNSRDELYGYDKPHSCGEHSRIELSGCAGLGSHAELDRRADPDRCGEVHCRAELNTRGSRRIWK